MGRALRIALATTLTSVLGLTLIAVGPAAGAGRLARATRCSDVNMPQIRATRVRASGLSCSFARLTVRRYFRKVMGSLAEGEEGCAFQRGSSGCRVRSFRCYTRGLHMRGVCRGPFGTVRFHEIDIGPY